MENVTKFHLPEDIFHGEIVNREFDGKTRTPRSKAAEPIKDTDEVKRVAHYILYERPYRNEEMRKRDYLLFILGITLGLRAGDLRQLKLGDVMDADGALKHEIILIEEKTAKTRGKKKNLAPGEQPQHRTVYRHLYLNSTAKEALRMYLEGRVKIDYNAPLFGNMSNNNSEQFFDTVHAKPKGTVTKYKSKSGTNEGISVTSISRILKQIMEETGVHVHASSHMLRKTFAYRIAATAEDWNRGLMQASTALQHSSPAMTVRYLGLQGEEIEDAYMRITYDLAPATQRKETETA